MNKDSTSVMEVGVMDVKAYKNVEKTCVTQIVMMGSGFGNRHRIIILKTIFAI